MVDDNADVDADVDADDHCKEDETNTDRSVYLYHGECADDDDDNAAAAADDDDDDNDDENDEVNYENQNDGCGYPNDCELPSYTLISDSDTKTLSLS